MSIPKPKSTFLYSAPNEVVPDRWLAAVLGSKRPMAERNIALALAYTADRVGNPIPGRSIDPLLWAATGYSYRRPAERMRVSVSIAALRYDGWIALKTGANQSGDLVNLEFRLTFPRLGGVS